MFWLWFAIAAVAVAVLGFGVGLIIDGYRTAPENTNPTEWKENE